MTHGPRRPWRLVRTGKDLKQIPISGSFDGNDRENDLPPHLATGIRKNAKFHRRRGLEGGVLSLTASFKTSLSNLAAPEKEVCWGSL